MTLEISPENKVNVENNQRRSPEPTFPNLTMRRSKAPPEPTQQWPPRSPHEALLSTPEGRKKYSHILSPSGSPSNPSPTRRLLFGSPSRPATAHRSPTKPSPAVRAMNALSAHDPDDLNDVLNDEANDDNSADDDDDDEETLQLKLEAIQAKLKLKKLMKDKKKTESASHSVTSAAHKKLAQPVATSKTRDKVGLLEDAAPITGKKPLTASRDIAQSKSACKPHATAPEPEEVQIPASPAKPNHGPSHATARDYGANVPTPALSIDVAGNSARQSLPRYLDRRSHARTSPADVTAAHPPKSSFLSRLSAARHEEEVRREKESRVRAARTNAFAITESQMNDFKAHATTIVTPAVEEQGFSREEVLRGKQTTPPKPVPTDEAAVGDDSLEPYSGLHLKTRILPHQELTRSLSAKKIMLLPEMLRDVKAPAFELPNVESDIVVMAAVASKSDPRTRRTAAEVGLKSNATAEANNLQADRSKYMVLTLTDLKYEVELFLFDSGFTRFWRLPTGTVVAILNPVVMPPPPGRVDTGRFSLVINCDADTILEIGTARDLGYCAALKKDGQMCSSWVNLRRTEFCEFHVNEQVKKKRANRMEVNTMNVWYPDDKKSKKKGAGPWRGGGNENGSEAKSEWARKKEARRNYDWESRSRFFVTKTATGDGLMTTAGLMDQDVEMFRDRKEREEFLRGKLAREEKERDIARKLGSGSGAGGQYLSHHARQQDQAVRLRQQQRQGQRGKISDNATAKGAVDDEAVGGDTAGDGDHVAGDHDQNPHECEDQPAPRSARELGLIPVQGRADLKLKRKRPRDISSVSATHTTAHEMHSSSTKPNAKNNKTALGWGSDLKSKLERMRDGEHLQIQPTAAGAASTVSSTDPPRPPPLNSTTTTTTTTTTNTTAAAAVTGGLSRLRSIENKDRDGPPARKKTRFLTASGDVKVAGRLSMPGQGDGDGGGGKGGGDSSDDDLVII